MYLTFDLNSKELIIYTDHYEGEKNIDVGGFSYLGEHIIVRDPRKSQKLQRLRKKTGFEVF